MNENLLNISISILKEDSQLVISKIINNTGSTPGKAGHIMLIRKNGSTVGSVGGGALEVYCTKYASNCNSKEKIISKHLILSTNGEHDLEMACGGEVDVEFRYFENNENSIKQLEDFLEVNSPPPRLIIFGAGHVSQALGPIMKQCGFNIVIIDNRKQFANIEVHPEAKECIVSEYKSFTEKFSFKKNDFIAIMTQGHLGDYDALFNCLKFGINNFKYVGLIGSKTKVGILFDKLKSKGFCNDDLEKIYAPIGFKNGGKSAYEIAVSIACQIIAVRYGYMDNYKYIE